MRRGWGFSFNLCVNMCVCMWSVPVGGLHVSMHVEAGIFNHSPLFSFRDRVLLRGAGWPGTHKANQADQNSQRATCPAS